MASGFEMRVGHAEREAVAAELREHYAVGRLTLDELNERLDAAFAAKTKGDLNGLTKDLPSGAGIGSGASIGSGTAPAGGDRAWNAGDWGPGAGWGADAGRRVGASIGSLITGFVMFGTLLALGSLSLFGLGAGKPFGVVLILAALGVLRRLIFSRRHAARGRGPRRRR
jgi:hypothetical protein